MEKFLEINTLSLAIFGASIFGILEYFFLRFKDTSDRNAKIQDTNEAAIIALLHATIFRNGCEYLRRGKVTVAELEDLEKLYKPYKEKGCNSTAKTIVDNVNRLPISSEDEKFLSKGDNSNG